MKGKWLAALVGLALLGGFGTAHAVPVPKLITHGIPHQALFDVAFDGANGYAVGAMGEIRATTDGGKTWKDEKTPTPLALLGVAVNAHLAVAVGQMGTVLIKNGSSPWQQVPSGTTERLMEVAIQGKTVVAVGAFGTLIRSVDSGQTWNQVKVDWASVYKGASKNNPIGAGFGPKLYACTYGPKGNLFVGGEIGLIMESSDHGQTWKAVHVGTRSTESTSPTVFGISINGNGVGVAVGQSGMVLRTADDGQTWNRVKSGTTAILLSALAKNNGNILISGAYSMLWSHDGGQTWEHIETKTGLVTSNWYSEVAGNADTDGDIVVGQGAKILTVKP